MSVSEHLTDDSSNAALHQEIQHFYARQMRFLDTADVAEWAATFTEDGVFAANAHPEPQRGRSAIELAARNAADQLARDGVQRRHWLGMLQVDARPDGTIRAQTYALVVSTARGGQPDVRLSCSCDDVLVRQDGRLLVQHRQVLRDDLR